MFNGKSRLLIASISLGMFMFGISCVAFASTGKEQAKQNKPSLVIIKGQKNIEAYKKAGLIHNHSGVVSSKVNNLVGTNNDFVTQGTSIPTSTWELTAEEYDFTYSMSNYVYTNYKFYPYAFDNSIYQDISPNSNQRIKVQCYLGSNNSLYYTLYDDYLDDDISIGLRGLDIAKTYYFKYTSVNGVQISGSGTIY